MTQYANEDATLKKKFKEGHRILFSLTQLPAHDMTDSDLKLAS